VDISLQFEAITRRLPQLLSLAATHPKACHPPARGELRAACTTARPGDPV